MPATPYIQRPFVVTPGAANTSTVNYYTRNSSGAPVATDITGRDIRAFVKHANGQSFWLTISNGGVVLTYLGSASPVGKTRIDMILTVDQSNLLGSTCKWAIWDYTSPLAPTAMLAGIFTRESVPFG
jgi:hypothetical protein